MDYIAQMEEATISRRGFWVMEFSKGYSTSIDYIAQMEEAMISRRGFWVME